MLYKKYMLYNDNMEIMLPSRLSMNDTYVTAGYNWISDDRHVTVNVTKGAAGINDSRLYQRLDKYYKQFNRNMSGFECKKILKREINRRNYGEMDYICEVSGYRFFNVFMLGSLEQAELILNLQCMESDSGEYGSIFANISASVRLFDKISDNGSSADVS